MNGVFSTLLHLLSLGSFGPKPDSTGFNYQRFNKNGTEERKNQENGLMSSSSLDQNSMALKHLRTMDLLTSARFGGGMKVAEMAGEKVARHIEADIESTIAILNRNFYSVRAFSRLLSFSLMFPVVLSLWIFLLLNFELFPRGLEILLTLLTVLTMVTTVALLAAIVDSFLQLPEDTVLGKIVAGLVLFGTVVSGLIVIMFIKLLYYSRS